MPISSFCIYFPAIDYAPSKPAIIPYRLRSLIDSEFPANSMSVDKYDLRDLDEYLKVAEDIWIVHKVNSSSKGY
jgi:hypothetical protein